MKPYAQEIKDIKEKKRVIPATFDPVFKNILIDKKNRNYLTSLISNITSIPKNVVDENMIILNDLDLDYYKIIEKPKDILVYIENNFISIEMNKYFYDDKCIQISFRNFINERMYDSTDTILEFQMRSETGIIDESYGKIYVVNIEKIKNIWYDKARKESLTDFEKSMLMLYLTSKQSLDELAKGNEDLMKLKTSLEEISSNEKIIYFYSKRLEKKYEKEHIEEKLEK